MGDVASKTPNYTDATSFDSALEVRIAVMQYCDEVEPLEATQFSIRRVVGEGFVVAIIAEPFGWLHIGKAG